MFGEGGVDRFNDLLSYEPNDFDRLTEFVIAPLIPVFVDPSVADLSGEFVSTSESNDLRITLVSSSLVQITGPTGYGMALIGDWIVENSAVADRFVGRNVFINSELGLIPLSLGELPLTITTKSDQTEQTGIVSRIDPLSLVSDSEWFSALSNVTSLSNASLPNFGIALGSQLKAGVFADQNAPLNDAVPYLFFASSGNDDSLQFGGLTISASGPGAGSGNGFFIAIDPSDFSIWVKGVTSEGAIALGYSQSGFIPFTPKQTPLAITNKATTKKIFGNLYGGGEFDIGSKFGLTGELVLDLNRNFGPGKGFSAENVTSSTFLNLLDGIGSFDLEKIGNVFANIELGVNGELSYTAGIESIVDVEIPLAEASLMYVDGNLIALRGAVPQDGIGFLNSFGIDVSLTATIDGFVKFNTGDFQIEIKAAAGGGIGGFRADGNFRLTLNNQFIDAELTARVPFAGSLALAGRVNWATGVFFITGKAEVTLAVFTTQMSFDLRNSAAQPSQVVLNAAAKLDYTWSSFLGKYGVEANFDTRISVGGDSLFEFDGGASGTIFWGPLGTTTLGIRIGTSGFTLDLPIIPDIKISFPRSLHGDMDATFTRIDPASSSQPPPLLSPVDIPLVVDEAIARLVAGGLTSTQAVLLRDVQFHVTRLDNRRQELAYATGNVVWIDSDAAGHGWYVDPTPSDDSEFDDSEFEDSSFENSYDAAHRESTARMDLLSALMHELTHVLETEYPGMEFNFGEIEDEFLSPGRRFEVTK